jgi:DNA sulfur modification protein DndE
MSGELTTFTKIHVGEGVDFRLRNIKARTALTPNLICRLGFCLSLAEPGIPDLGLYQGGQEREFNRYTLTGPWDTLFLALLRERLERDGLDSAVQLESQFKAHLSRGVYLLSQRLKRPSDVARLVVQRSQLPAVDSLKVSEDA